LLSFSACGIAGAAEHQDSEGIGTRDSPDKQSTAGPEPASIPQKSILPPRPPCWEHHFFSANLILGFGGGDSHPSHLSSRVANTEKLDHNEQFSVSHTTLDTQLAASLDSQKKQGGRIVLLNQILVDIICSRERFVR
jgi:hypothetical protein